MQMRPRSSTDAVCSAAERLSATSEHITPANTHSHTHTQITDHRNAFACTFSVSMQIRQPAASTHSGLLRPGCNVDSIPRCTHSDFCAMATQGCHTDTHSHRHWDTHLCAYTHTDANVVVSSVTVHERMQNTQQGSVPCLRESDVS